MAHKSQSNSGGGLTTYGLQNTGGLGYAHTQEQEQIRNAAKQFKADRVAALLQSEAEAKRTDYDKIQDKRIETLDLLLSELAGKPSLFAGNGIAITAAGEVSATNIFPQPKQGRSYMLFDGKIDWVSGAWSTAYEMGTTKEGSSENSTTAAEADLTLPKTDTWDQQFPPSKIGDATKKTLGVKLQFISRIKVTNNSASGNFREYTFGRHATFNHLGHLQKISKETIISDEVVSGSGSGGGGL